MAVSFLCAWPWCHCRFMDGVRLLGSMALHCNKICNGNGMALSELGHHLKSGLSFNLDSESGCARRRLKVNNELIVFRCKPHCYPREGVQNNLQFCARFAI